MVALDNLVAKPAPIEKDDDGVYRVSGTRVRLETIINAFIHFADDRHLATRNGNRTLYILRLGK